MSDEGFSVAEVLCALLVLSLTAIPLGNAISQNMRYWATFRSDVTALNASLDRFSRFDATERGKNNADQKEGLAGEAGEGPFSDLVTRDKRHADASCEFDLVGQNCR